MADRRQIPACGTRLTTCAKLLAFSDEPVRKPIKPAIDPLQLSSAMQPQQVFSRNPDHGGGRLAIFVPVPTRDLIFPPVAYRIQYLSSVNSTQHLPILNSHFLGR